MIDALLFALTAAIEAGALWMALGLGRRQSERIENLRRVGLSHEAWPIAMASGLGAAALGLVVGWWITPIGVASIVVIKISYALMLIGYRRAGEQRVKDIGSVVMTVHSLASLALIIGW